ncbi:MAG: acyl-CoA dehydrogenase family protein [Actinomycetota bacterium]
MSVTDHTTAPITIEAIKASVDSIGDVLQAASADAEALGRLSADAAEALRSTELFKCWWPAELGGPNATVRDGIEIIEAVAAVDTSAAWNLAVCTLGSGLAGAYLEQDAVEAIFAEDLPLIAGQTAPVGRAVPVEGGVEVSGQWSFGSGIHLASWVKAGVLIERADGAPEPAIVVVPAERVTIDEESWNVAGLAGSGSYNYSMDGVHVPDGYWYSFPVADPKRGGATYRLPIPGQLVILHAGFALGVAQRCLDEITGMATAKIRQFDDASIGTRGTFQFALAENHAAVSAARLHTYDVADRMVEAADTPEAPTLMREMRAAARYANDVALEIATWAFRQGGGAALRLDHPLQRLLRDMFAATQHIYVDDRAYTDHGMSLIGLRPPARSAPAPQSPTGATR